MDVHGVLPSCAGVTQPVFALARSRQWPQLAARLRAGVVTMTPIPANDGGTPVTCRIVRSARRRSPGRFRSPRPERRSADRTDRAVARRGVRRYERSDLLGVPER